MGPLPQVARRIAAILRRLRYERFSCQWLPVDQVVADLPDAVRWVAALPIEPETHATLFCHPASSVRYRVDAHPGDCCVAGCSLMPEMWNRNLGGVEFTIAVRSADGALLREARRIADPGTRPEDRRWNVLRVPLPIDRPQPVTITLSTRVPDWYAGDNAWAVWGDPAIERPRSRKDIRALMRLAVQLSRQVGATRALRALGLAGRAEHSEYRVWSHLNAVPQGALARMASDVPALAHKPLISILTPVYNTPPELLRACARSVMGQLYPHWEWCVCDDASTSAETRAAVGELSDPRIRVIRLQQNSGIAGASQAALASATGEFIALLDHDDELTPDALLQVVRRLNDRPDTDVVYSDEDKLDEDGGLCEPFFKPDWSPEHLLTTMYTCHLTVARRTVVERAGGFRAGTDSAQDHDLMLRVMELTDRIEHVPHVLYHWRRTAMSTASTLSAKPWADSAGFRAVEDYLRRNRLGTEVLPSAVPGRYRARFDIRGQPTVLIVIVGETATLRDECAARVRERTTYPMRELTGAARRADHVNAAIQDHAAEYVVLVDANLDPTDPEWLTALLEYAQQPAIGVAGGKVTYADRRLRHVGIILGAGGGAGRILHQHLDTYGYFASTIGARNYSAVSSECFMTRRDVFDEVGGFDEGLPWSVADLDYCLKARRTGRRVVFTPYAGMQMRPGAEPAPLPSPQEIDALRQRWGSALDTDPFSNPHFDATTVDYQLRSLTPARLGK